VCACVRVFLYACHVLGWVDANMRVCVGESWNVCVCDIACARVCACLSVCVWCCCRVGRCVTVWSCERVSVGVAVCCSSLASESVSVLQRVAACCSVLQ